MSFNRPLGTAAAYPAIRRPSLNILRYLFVAIALFISAITASAQIVQYSQGFEVDDDWGAGGTAVLVNRVPSGTNGIASKTGGFHGEIVAGRFTRWGGYSSVFPTNGFSTSVDIYLDMAGAYANDTRFDWSSAISDTGGSHRRDFVFSGGFYNDAGPYGSGPRFVFTAGNNTPGWPRNPAAAPVVVSSSGWYTMRHTFLAGTGGVLVTKLELLNSSGVAVGTWSLSNPADIIGSTVGGNRYGWLVTSAFPFLAMDNSQRIDLPPAEIINASLGNPLANPNAWFFYNDENDTIDNVTLGSMVTGPATPPIGNGSAQISVTGTQRRNLATYQFSGTPLASLGTLRYSTYNPSAGNGGSPNRSGYLQFNVDFNGTDTWQRRLTFLPGDNGAVVQNSWQEWDAINGGAALWRYSGPTWPVGVGGGGEPGTTTKTWNQILSQYPGVRMRVTDSFFGIRVGEPYNDGYTENLDAIKFGTPSFLKHFNFDPLPPITYVDDSWVGTIPGTDPDGAGPATNFGYDAFATIQGGINGVALNGTVNVAAGTYNEDVAVNKTVILNGAGPTGVNVVGQIGGDGATIRITANNVEVSGLTITRAGNNTTDWNNAGLNFAGIAMQGLAITGANIHDNYITGNRTGIDLNATGGHSIHNNLIDFNRTGVIMRNQTDNLNFFENFVTNNWTVGILFIDASSGSNVPPQTCTGCTFFNNSISGNWYGGIEDRQSGGSLPVPGTTNLKNFSGNSFGTATPVVTVLNGTEPGYAAQIPVEYGGAATNPGGSANIQGQASANFDYSPFLTFGGDTNPAVYGFQGNFSALNVSSGSAQVGPTSKIQEAIDLITPGGVLTIPTATYPGNVNVNKAITLMGTFTVGGTMTVSSAGATLSPGYSPGIINTGNFSLVSGSNLNIELNGNIAGALYDQVNVTGTVSLGGANLVTTVGYFPTAGHTYTIINNDGGDAVAGTFNGLPEGTVFFVGPNSFRISYVGGTGNDVVLTSVALCNAVSIPTNITSLTGQTVNVPVNVDDTTGNGLLSTDFTLTYNSSVLSAPVVTEGTVTAGRLLTVNDTTPGVLIISIFGSSPFAGAGTIANVQFTVNGLPGTSSPVAFTSFKFNEGTPCAPTSNGLVTVLSGTISGTVTYGNAIGAPAVRPIPDVTLNAVGSVNVSATTGPTVSAGTYTLSGMGSGAYTVTPSKVGGVTPFFGNTITGNDAALVAQHVVGLASPALVPSQLTAADVSGTGGITSFDAALIARWVALLPSSGNTGAWIFTPANIAYPNVNTNSTGQDYSAILMGDVTGNYIQSPGIPRPAPVDDPTALVARAGSVTAGAGSSVSIPLTVGDTTDRGVVSYQFELRFDPDVLEPQAEPIDLSGSLSEGYIATVNATERGRLIVVVFGAQPLTGAGTLLSLRFNTIGAVDSTSRLEWGNFLFNEGEVPFRTVDGQLRVTAATEGVINGRVVSQFGEPIGRTRVIAIDTAGNRRIATTSSFGHFQFGELQVGETYVLRVDSKRYRFAPQSVSLTSGVAAEVQLIAQD